MPEATAGGRAYRDVFTACHGKLSPRPDGVWDVQTITKLTHISEQLFGCEENRGEITVE